MHSDEALAAKLAALLPHLDERQRRLVLGAEASALGRGGIRAVARAAGTSAVTVSRGVAELAAGPPPLGRTRRPGGGRKPVTTTDPALTPALLALLEPESPDDRARPPLRWTTRSTRQLARALADAGHHVSAPTAAKLLRAEGFSLRGNDRAVAGDQPADRNAQFRYVNEQAVDHLGSGDPVIAIEMVKRLAEPGEHNAQAGPEHNAIGTDEHAAFAVSTIRWWWRMVGQDGYPLARRLLIAATGDSNGYRSRLWKAELARLATEAVLTVTVCHLPPGTSRWSDIDYQLCSEVRTEAGHDVPAAHVVGVAIIGAGSRPGAASGSAAGNHLTTSEQQAAWPQLFHGEWNYSLTPAGE